MVKANIKLDDYDLLVKAGPLLTKDGRELKVKRWQAVGQGLLALAIEGVAFVDQAEQLHGVAVYLDRDRWPESNDEVYLDELIGAEVLGPDGAALGRVHAVVDLPAGPALEILVIVENGSEVKVLPLVPEFIEIGDDLRLTEFGVAVLSI
jgi:ribosomal 30S subunit maturation factor RimM